MKARGLVGWVGAAIFLAASSGAVSGCGGSRQPAWSLPQKASEMPAGQTWDGVYYNPVYGYLHVVGADGNMTGRWRRTNASAWGELSGNAEGNLFRFTWTEHKYGEIGPASDIHGSGIFVYKVGQNDIGELDGQYAVDGSDSVGDWHCIKQVGMKPDINSINGDNPLGAPAQDSWK